MTVTSTVFVVDDDPLIHSWLSSLFKSAGIQTRPYDSGHKFIRDYKSDHPGCILLDLKMPGISGLEIQKILQERENTTPIIFLTGTANVESAVEALKKGAFDFLEKPLERDLLLACINKALDHDIRTRYEGLQKSQATQKFSLLTNREQEVLRWLIDGKPNKIIANLLNISIRTVEVHRKNIMQKMAAGSLAGLIKMTLEV